MVVRQMFNFWKINLSIYWFYNCVSNTNHLNKQIKLNFSFKPENYSIQVHVSVVTYIFS